MRTISDDGIELIKRFEAFRPSWYQCAANVWTCGYGHAETSRDGEVTEADLPVGFSVPLTEEGAEELLQRDLERYERAVDENVEDELSQSQFDALVSFCYNVGIGAFRGSTLLKRVNQADHEAAADQFLRWKYADGEVLEGLLRRRKAEAALYRADRPGVLEVEPAEIDPAPVQPVPVRLDLEDPDHYPIRSAT